MMMAELRSRATETSRVRRVSVAAVLLLVFGLVMIELGVASAGSPPPTLHITGISEGEWYGHDVTPGAYSDDASASIVATLDGSAWPLNDNPVTAEGDHTFLVAATSVGGQITTATAHFTIDKTRPNVVIPVFERSVFLEASGPDGASFTFHPSCWDTLDPIPGLSISVGNPHTFPVGSTVVTFTATDAAGNEATTSATVTVRDTTAPSLATPSDITLEGNALGGAVVSFIATATDIVDGVYPATCVPPSGSTFPVGSTMVSCTATDAAGNTRTGTFAITVKDTTPPEISVPGDLLVEATAPSGAVATYAVTATDLVGGTRPVVCSPSSGSTFPFGMSSVSCTASDAAGNARTAIFRVTVEDHTPPTTDDDALETWQDRPVTVALTASDTASDISVTRWWLNGEGPVTYTTRINVTDEGTNTLEYRSQDVYGNVEDTETALVLIDQSDPETSADATATYTGTAAINLLATDAYSGVASTVWTLDGVEGTGALVTTDAPGLHTLSYHSIDSAGNEEAPHEVSFTVVGSSSLVLSTGSASGMGYGASVVVSGTLSAAGGPVVGVPVILESSASSATGFASARTATTSASGAFTFTVNPKSKTFYRVAFSGDATHTSGGPTSAISLTPGASVGTVHAPSTMYRSRYYTVYGYLKPRHSNGTYPVRIYKYRYVGGHWKSYGYVKAKASNYSTYTKYSVKMRLPYAGKWYVRAYAPADSGHVATWSSGHDHVTAR